MRFCECMSGVLNSYKIAREKTGENFAERRVLFLRCDELKHEGMKMLTYNSLRCSIYVI